MKRVIAVGIGGAVGSLFRYGISLLLNGALFPFGTLAANVLGALGLGFFYAWVETRPEFSEAKKALIATGIFGSLTTFSTFSFEVTDFLLDGNVLMAFIYISGSLISGILFAIIGIKSAEMWWTHGVD